MSPEVLLLAGGGLVAGVISGISGFGFALTATALWMQVLEPRVVAVLAVSFTLLLNVAYLPLFWRRIDLRRLAPMAAGGVLGVPVGVQLLAQVPATLFRGVIGLVLLAYGLAALRRRPGPPLRLAGRGGFAADAGVGAAAGVLGGAGGLSGFLPALWAPMRGWDKLDSRALVQAYVFFTNLVALAWFGGLGLGGDSLRAFAIALPFVLVGMALGLKLFARLDGARFHRTVLWVITGSGALLAAQLLPPAVAATTSLLLNKFSFALFTMKF